MTGTNQKAVAANAATLRTEHVGSWTRDHYRRVTADDLDRYAAAINCRQASGSVSPVFAYSVAQDAVSEALLSVVGDYPRHRILNGEIAFTQDQPLAAGQVYVSRARPRRIEDRGKGTAILVEATTAGPDGTPVGRLVQTAYLPGLRTGRDLGEPLSDETRLVAGGESREVVFYVDVDQAARFTAATGEDNPIHRDAGAARQAGLPGIIVQGTCLLAMVTDVIAAELAVPPSAVRRLQARFAAPVTPGQDVRASLQSFGGGRYAFSARDGEGITVLTRGLVELRIREGEMHGAQR